MKKFVSLFMCGLLVFSPYSLDLTSLVDAEEGESVPIEDVDQGSEELIEISNEEEISQNLISQIDSIEKSLEEVKDTELGEELSGLIEEIESININEIVIENLEGTKGDIGIDNVEPIIESITSKNIPVTTSAIGKFFSESSVSAEGDTEEAIIEDVFSDYTTSEPENLLIDSNVSLNIVMTEGDATVVKTIEEVADKASSGNGFSFSDIFEKNVGNASNSGYGYFFAAHNVAVANAKTTSSKFLNIGTILTSGGVLRPQSYTIELKNKNKTASSSSVAYSVVKQQKIFSAVMKKDYVLESPISKSYFWNAEATFVGTFKDGSKDSDRKVSDRFLLNKKGVKYPVYKDPKSNKVMHEPSYTTWTKQYYPESWTTSKRNSYIKWYESNYGKLTWSEYEIHHIRPRVYYGSNDYSNLIPLKRTYHRSTVSPWWTNY